MNTQKYRLNIRPGIGVAPIVKVSQNDVGRTLAFSLHDNVSAFIPPSGATVTITGKKPSGLGFTETCTLTGSVAKVNTTLEMTQEFGTVPAELRLTSGNTTIGTANFMLSVEPSPHPDGTTDGTHDTMDNLQTQITSLQTDIVELQSGGYVADAQQIQAKVNAYLSNHPEIAVLDGSLTESKFSDALKLKTIKDYVTPEMFGAKGDGVTDDTASITACFNHCASNGITNVIFGFGKTYLANSFEIPALDNLTVDFNGSTIKNINTEDGSSDRTIISLNPTAKYSATGNVTITKGSNSVVLPQEAYSTVAVGDIVWVYSDTLVNQYNSSVYGLVVQKASDNTVVLNVSSEYTLSDTMNIVVIKPVRGVTIKNGIIEDNVAKIYSLSAKNVYNARFENLKFNGNGGRVGLTVIGFNTVVDKIQAVGYTDSAHSSVTGYGINVSGVNVVVENSYVINCKHGIASANRQYYSKNIIYKSNVVVSDKIDALLDFHGTTEGTMKDNLLVTKKGYGIYIRAKNTVVENNTIVFTAPEDTNDKAIALLENAFSEIIIKGNRTVSPSAHAGVMFESMADNVSNIVIDGNITSRIVFGANKRFSNIIIANNLLTNDGQIRVNAGTLENNLIEGNTIDIASSADGTVYGIAFISGCVKHRIINNRFIHYNTSVGACIREYGGNIICNNEFNSPNAGSSYDFYIYHADSSASSVIANNLYVYSDGYKMDS